MDYLIAYLFLMLLLAYAGVNWRRVRDNVKNKTKDD
jgi:hypothetical protein